MLDTIKRAFKRFIHRLVRSIRRLVRACYRMGTGMCLFISGVAVFVIVGIIIICTVPASRARQTQGTAKPTPTFDPASIIATPDPDEVLTADPGGTVILNDPLIPAESPTPTPDITLKKGDRSEEVTKLQSRLMDLGYLGLDEPTNYFGNATKSAIQLFQRQHSLDQDGIAGAATQELLYSKEAKPYVLYEGAEGKDVREFQELLYELGYLTKAQITGYFGTATTDAVKKFQQRNHLTKDGKAGEKTIEMLNSDDARVSYAKEKEIAEEKKKAEEAARLKTVEGRIDEFISIAKKQLGKPYILGDKGPDSYDCSGLVYYCLRQLGVYTRRLNAAGFSRTSRWTEISSLDNVKKGDLLFFKTDTSDSVGHVGIYVGSGEMIDASSANGEVVRRSAKSSYWRRNFVNARRPIE